MSKLSKAAANGAFLRTQQCSLNMENMRGFQILGIDPTTQNT